MDAFREIRTFIVHLRLPYQFFILSGAYLLGGLLSPQTDLRTFLIQYFSVHFFLFGGVTAYNSYWDKDEGPIGGLKHPPKMERWMLPASWLLQLLGLRMGAHIGTTFIVLYVTCMALSWAYSSPLVRLKGRPLLSLLATGSAIAFSSLLGFFAYGGESITGSVLIGCIAVGTLIVSLYPLSQVYQIPEDRRRGDRTFAVTYGIDGIRNIFLSLFLLSIAIVSVVLWRTIGTPSLVLPAGALLLSIWILRALRIMQCDQDDYRTVMNIKYVGGMFLATFLTVMLVLV